MGSYLMAAAAPTNSGALIALGMSGVLMAPGIWWLNRYYAAKFGRQVWKPGRFSKAFLPVYFVIASLLNAWIPSIPAGAPTAATVAVASTWIAIVPGAYGVSTGGAVCAWATVGDIAASANSTAAVKRVMRGCLRSG